MYEPAFVRLLYLTVYCNKYIVGISFIYGYIFLFFLIGILSYFYF